MQTDLKTKMATKGKKNRMFSYYKHSQIRRNSFFGHNFNNFQNLTIFAKTYSFKLGLQI